jgi:hypothetical protein
MRRSRRIAIAAATALALCLGSHLALAQKSGGVLKMPDFASPASMSIHEEVTRAAVTVLMPVFNNLVLFDQHKEKNTLDTIGPDLAESCMGQREKLEAGKECGKAGQVAIIVWVRLGVTAANEGVRGDRPAAAELRIALREHGTLIEPAGLQDAPDLGEAAADVAHRTVLRTRWAAAVAVD